MKIAIAGGTGTLGREVAHVLYDRGHEVRILSRGGPYRVDLLDGSGLDEALEGVDAVIDAANGTKRDLVVDGTGRLLRAGQRAGVRHHVAVSIVGIDGAPGGYYRLKREQERAVKIGLVPFSIVRATQFHSLLDGYLSKAARFGVRPSGALRVQPVDPRELAHVLAETVERAPSSATAELAGPEIATLRELGREWARTTGRHTIPLHVPVPRSLRHGALTNPDAPRGSTTFAQWLAERQAAPVSPLIALAGAPRHPGRPVPPLR